MTSSIMVVAPHDEDPHQPEAASNDNESISFEAFAPRPETGGCFAFGNTNVDLS